MSKYSISNDTLTRLANAVRARFKLSGVLTLEEMITYILPPPVVNHILTSTTEPGGTEIFGDGAGYMDGYRWSSSSNGVVTHNVGRISGWIPYKAGVMCYVRGFKPDTTGYVNGLYFVTYKNGGAIQVYTIGKPGSGATYEYEYDSATDTASFMVPNGEYAYFRISSYINADVFPIITLGESIPDNM